jgi:hypothetical protein
MNQRSDIDRVLEVWMADGPTAIPDRVVDVVAARIGVQRQRRAWPFPWRTTVTTQVKLIAALAAVIVVAVAGFALLGRPSGSNVGGNPSATPSPSPVASASPSLAASPSAAASTRAALPAWYTIGAWDGAGILAAGNHATRSFTPGFSYRVPAGWVNPYDSASFASLFPDTPANRAEFARSGELAQSIYMGPHQSPWFACEEAEDNPGATAAEILAKVTASEVLATSNVADVAIGGLTGKQFDVRLNPDWTGTCPPKPEDPPDLADMRTRAVLLDTPDRRVIVIFLGSVSSAGHEAFLAQAMPIVESFKFNLAP